MCEQSPGGAQWEGKARAHLKPACVCAYYYIYTHVLYLPFPVFLISSCGSEAGCSQEEGPKKGFVMGSRTQGVQEILEKCI